MGLRGLLGTGATIWDKVSGLSDLPGVEIELHY